MKHYSEFRDALRKLINQNSMENHSNTADYILAEYLADCLSAFDRATRRRDSHKGINSVFETAQDLTKE